jgi:hypothetical protein
MNEQQLAAVKQALELMHNRGDVGVDEWIAAEAAIKQAIAQDALDKKAENARELGLDYEPAVQEPVAQNNCIECANADSWGLPDKPFCRSCVSNSEWKPLNASSKNPATPPAAQPAVQEGRDWSLLEATQESLREHMAEIKRLKAAQPVKTYHDGKPWPVAPAPDPAPIIQQLVTALEGSGTRMRSDQWYIEIEAVAAGKFYLNSKGEGL